MRAGKRAVLESGARHLWFGTAWVYAAHSNNVLRTRLRVGAEREELRVVADQIGTPTPAALIADVTSRALQSDPARAGLRSEEHTSELQSLMRNSYAVFCLKKKETRKQLTPCPHTNYTHIYTTTVGIL